MSQYRYSPNRVLCISTSAVMKTRLLNNKTIQDQESERHHTNLSQSAIIIDEPDEPAQPLFPRGQLVCKIMVRPDDFSI